MKMRILRVLAVVVVWGGAGVIWMHRRAPPANPAVTLGLTFVNQSSAVPSVLPGQYSGVVTLENKSAKPVTNVRLTTSCFCTHIDGLKDLGALQPGASRQISYHLDCIKAGIMTESINASDGASLFPVTEVPVTVHVLNPIEAGGDTLNFPVLHRTIYGTSTEAIQFSAPVAPGVTGIALKTDIPWLHVTQTAVSSGIFHAMLYADGDSPEGTSQSIARMVLNYNGHTSKGEMPCTCTVQSAVAVKPHNLFFGVMRLGQGSAELPVAVSGNFSRFKDITVHSSVAGLDCHVTGANGDTLTVVAKLVPRNMGNITGNITILQGASPVARVPVSAFVTGK